MSEQRGTPQYPGDTRTWPHVDDWTRWRDTSVYCRTPSCPVRIPDDGRGWCYGCKRVRGELGL